MLHALFTATPRSTEMLLIQWLAASRHFGRGAALGRTRRLNLEESACVIPSVLPVPAKRRYLYTPGLR